MLKKPVSTIAALVLLMSLATNGFAAFENFHLIRVVSDKTPGSTQEIATDLGDITALAALSNTTVGGGGDAFINFNSNPFASLSVNYFAVNRTNALNGTMYIGANTPSAPATGGVAAIQNKLSITSANAPPTPISVNKYYSTLPLAAGSTATVIANNSNASSFSGMFGSTTLGGYAGYTGTWASNANLALTNLTETAPIAMTVWQFGPGNMAAEFTGVRVLDLDTNADGSTTINPTVTKTDQTIGAITFDPATLAVDGATTASATSTSGLPVTFTSTTPDVCTVSGSTITGITAGICTIAADQDGDATFNAAPRVTLTIEITGSIVVNGACGSSNGGTFTAAPATDLCSAGNASLVTGSGPWNWACGGLNGGTNASCSAIIQSYAVTFQSGGNGTLTGATNQTVNHGASATAVTAVPSPGYHFVNWTGTGGFVTTGANPLTVNNVTAGMTITANFAADPVNGICGSSNGGTFNVAPATNLCSAGNASLVTGSGPWNWSCGGLNGGTTATCSATVPAVSSKARVVGGADFGSLGEAYGAAADGAEILLISTGLVENLTMNRNPGITVKLKGGYSADFSVRSGQLTALKGTLIVRTGSLTADRLAMK